MVINNDACQNAPCRFAVGDRVIHKNLSNVIGVVTGITSVKSPSKLGYFYYLVSVTTDDQKINYPDTFWDFY